MTNFLFKPVLVILLLTYTSGRPIAYHTASELILPQGFRAETVVESLGSNRHLVVNSNGDIYVHIDRLQNGKGILVLRNKNGKYEQVKSFGDYIGTGIAIKNGYLYASSNDE